MMINTEKLKKAVRSFNEYSPSQRTILELFIDIAIDNVVHVSAKYITLFEGLNTLILSQ